MPGFISVDAVWFGCTINYPINTITTLQFLQPPHTLVPPLQNRACHSLTVWGAAILE